MPITSLAVDGSARTFNWVDVVPSTGAIAGWGGGGRGVSDGCTVVVGCKVAVMITGMAVAVSSIATFALHPANSREIRISIDLLGLLDTRVF